VLIVIDGLRRDTAQEHLTAPSRLIAAGRGLYLPMTSHMPTNSRPSYNTISTGVPSPQNGTIDNDDVRPVTIPSVWTVARSHGLTTAASAYFWWSELFNSLPFREERQIYTEDSDGGIQHGFFYPRASETDATVVAEAEILFNTYRPDLLLIHPSSTDYAGDYWGAGSVAYVENAKVVNVLMAALFESILRNRPETIVLVTSDHGMSDRGGHGWDAPELREVFFFALGDSVRSGRVSGADVANQSDATSLDVAPTILSLLGLPIPPGMKGSVVVAAD
jgi:predicted AlkP superfamily pyrophosphatase or phosphodiesterase